MSEVKRYSVWDDELFDEKHAINARNGMVHLVVKFDDYAELQDKCAALAAENAGLNDKMNRLLVWPGIEFCSSAWEFCNLDGNDALEMMCDKETPATDAILAETELKAIRKFINSIEHILRDKLSPYDTEEMLEAMRIFLEEQGGAEL